MEIECEEFVKSAKVGQFLMLKAQQQDFIVDPLLRRPFGICDIEGNKFKILYTIIGKGTQLITHIKPKTIIDFSEPLGNTFKLVENSKIALVAGGVGIAPLLLLAKELKNKNNNIVLYYGGRTTDDIVLIDELAEIADKLIITTDDGSVGIKGLVTEPFEKNISDFDIIYACGPKKMLKVVSELSVKNKVKVEVSMDERMACGIGACLGCIIYIKDENNQIVQKRCCVEGPVFDGSKVVWK
jgi:dihydroorotate dehydrogenase electron transfer subunit